MWLSIVFTRWPRSYTKYFYEPNYNVLNDFNSQSYEPLHKFQWIIPMDYTNALPYNLLVILFIYILHSSTLNLENKWYAHKVNATFHVKCSIMYYLFDRVALHRFLYRQLREIKTIEIVLTIISFTAIILFILTYIHAESECFYIEPIWECVHFKIMCVNFFFAI